MIGRSQGSIMQGTSILWRSASLASARKQPLLREHYECGELGEVPPDQQGRRHRQFPGDAAIRNIIGRG